MQYSKKRVILRREFLSLPFQNSVRKCLNKVLLFLLVVLFTCGIWTCFYCLIAAVSLSLGNRNISDYKMKSKQFTFSKSFLYKSFLSCFSIPTSVIEINGGDFSEVNWTCCQFLDFHMFSLLIPSPFFV